MGDKRKNSQKDDAVAAQAETPDVGQTSQAPVEPINLALHSDGISHWQDEPVQSDQKKSRTGQGGRADSSPGSSKNR